MRALGLEAKIAAIWGVSALMLLVMDLPWSGPAPAGGARPESVTGRWDAVAAAVPRWLGPDAPGRSAWEALHRTDAVLAALLAATCGLAVLCLVAAVEHAARALAPLPALGVAGIVVAKLADPPGAAPSEPRYGVFAALACAGLLASSARGLGAAPLRGRRRSPAVAPRAPTVVYDPRGSAPPPGTGMPEARPAVASSERRPRRAGAR
jgi:hypothetical protein